MGIEDIREARGECEKGELGRVLRGKWRFKRCMDLKSTKCTIMPSMSSVTPDVTCPLPMSIASSTQEVRLGEQVQHGETLQRSQKTSLHLDCLLYMSLTLGKLHLGNGASNLPTS